jgi:putative long chain acyl-CoA synthase
MLHELVDAPEHPGERHHSLRLFIGSGMPPALWRRVQRRFRPARVLEFYAATESSAVLVNVSGAKLGSMGRPLPGSAEVRLAAYDVAAGRYVLGRDGFVTPCGPGEIGLLLARARAGEEGSATKLRGVFERGDAWIDTGDLFRRDADGDYWRVDSLADVILTEAGPVFTVPIRDALSTISAVELAVAYGVVRDREDDPIVSAAVTLQPDTELVLRDLNAALRSLPREQRPQFVRVVDEIPVTTWYRPLTVSLREQGMPEPGDGRPLWRLDPAGETYAAVGGTP